MFVSMAKDQKLKKNISLKFQCCFKQLSLNYILGIQHQLNVIKMEIWKVNQSQIGKKLVLNLA